MTDRDELRCWLRLLQTPGVGRRTARRLLGAFGSAPAVFDATTAARRQVVGVELSSALEALPADFEDHVAALWRWLDEARPAQPRCVVAIGEALYPPLLLETPDPPLLLYVAGRAERLTAGSVAVVGSRNPTPQGRDNARSFARALSRAGWTVVSGLALGIDAAAHEGALDGAASTIAVVGTGLDRVYPARHRSLAHRIASEGALVSELPLGTPPLASNFPSRNRIIAGLARATLVVEAALQSGSLITARLAADANRDVFAIPGSIHAPQSRGCHGLIKQGAKLVDSASDLLDELGIADAAALSAPAADVGEVAAPSRDDDALLDAMGYDPVSLDVLVARTGWSAAQLGVRLLELELEGRVARLPGSLFQRRAAA